MTTTRVEVRGATPYAVVIGRDLLDEVSAALGPADRVAVVHSDAQRSRAEAVAERLRADRREVFPIEVPDAEAAKTLAVAGRCWDTLGDAGFTRSDAMVTVGGGAVTDLGGWVAAAWLRGVRVVHVPTTLLAMVDAAVGGKTGINTDAGKNLVGAFHPPAGVVCDLDALRSLPAADLAAGLAEVVKSGFIADPQILDLVEADPPAAMDPDGDVLPELVRRAVAVKADVVGDDLTEQGRREILNYGHTLGHAIERAEHYTWRHGDAVSVGLVYAAELGRRSGHLDAATADRHGEVLRSLGLPTTYAGAPWAQLHDSMRVDKKARGSRLRFVVLDGLARPTILDDPPAALLVDAFDAVRETVRVTERVRRR